MPARPLSLWTNQGERGDGTFGGLEDEPVIGDRELSPDRRQASRREIARHYSTPKQGEFSATRRELGALGSEGVTWCGSNVGRVTRGGKPVESH